MGFIRPHPPRFLQTQMLEIRRCESWKIARFLENRGLRGICSLGGSHEFGDSRGSSLLQAAVSVTECEIHDLRLATWWIRLQAFLSFYMVRALSMLFDCWVDAVENFICKAGESHPRLPKGSLVFPCLALRNQSSSGSSPLPHTEMLQGNYIHISNNDHERPLNETRGPEEG